MVNNKRTVASKDGTCTKYIIKKNGKRYNSKAYDTYEQARSYVRKKLRGEDWTVADYSARVWSNPSHSRYGFSIEKKAA